MKKFVLLGLSIFLLTSCAKKQPASQNAFMLNTICNIKIYEEKNKEKTADELINEAFELCADYEDMLSVTIEYSDIYKINHSNGEAVEVSDSTIEILKKAIYYSSISDGAFDITTGPLSTRWDFEGENPSVPPAEEIKELLNKVDYSKIKIEGNSVTLEAPVEAINLGAIAKGYITDKLAEYLKDNGVTSAMISLGGNLYAIGSYEYEKRPFNLGIQNPKSQNGSILGYVSLENKSFVTSGDYERYFIENGVRYHHILDPKTGWPAESGVSSVSIISDSSTDGDALSTTCFVLGIEKGLELVNSLDNIEAVFVDNDNNLYFSDGFNKDLNFITAE